jgi:hypothetical protein
MNWLIDWYRAADAGIGGAVTGMALAVAGVLFWGLIRLTARIAGTFVGTFAAYRIYTRDETLRRLQTTATARAERKEKLAALRERERQREQAMTSR